MTVTDEHRVAARKVLQAYEAAQKSYVDPRTYIERLVDCIAIALAKERKAAHDDVVSGAWKGRMEAKVRRLEQQLVGQVEENGKLQTVAFERAERIAELTEELCKTQSRNADLERWQASSERSMEIIHSAAELMKEDPERCPGAQIPDMLADVEKAHARIAELERERDRLRGALKAPGLYPPTDETDRKPTL